MLLGSDGAKTQTQRVYFQRLCSLTFVLYKENFIKPSDDEGEEEKKAKTKALQLENKNRNKPKYSNNNNKCKWIFKVYCLEK